MQSLDLFYEHEYGFAGRADISTLMRTEAAPPRTELVQLRFVETVGQRRGASVVRRSWA
jgi:hypothetical protein